MIEFTDIDFRPQGPKEPMMHHHEHHHECEPFPCPPPPFDPELKKIFDLAAHADRVAHKALDVAGYANLDASAAKKLAERTFNLLSKVSVLANKANLKSGKALAEIDILKDELSETITKLGNTQAGAGLAADGSYVKNDSSNYLKDAESLADADNKLDAAIKETNNAVETLTENVETVQAEVDGFEEELEQINAVQGNIIAAVGLKETGKYQKGTNSIINTAKSALEADELLAGAIEELTEEVDAIQDVADGIDEIADQVDANAADISNLKAKDRELQGEIDGIQLQRVNPLSYNLLVNGEVKGTINIPQDQFLSQVEYDPTTKTLIFTIDSNVIRVPVSDLVDTYTAGNGITISANQVAVKIDANSEKGNNGIGFLTSTQDGLKIDGIVEEINEAYVAGPGLDRTGNLHTDDHATFFVKVQDNSLPYLKAEATGLKLDVDAIAQAIGGSGEVDYEAIENYLKTSPTFNSWIDGKIQAAVEAAMLWQVNATDNTMIEPKDNKNVFVDGTIEATGAIYSGQ